MNTTTSSANKVTRRSIYNDILKVENIPGHVRQWVENELTKMDTANINRQSKPSKKEQENQPIKNSIFSLLTDSGAKVASEIADALSISTSKASALCRQMVEDGRLTVAEVKSPKKGGGKVKQYTAVKSEDSADPEMILDAIFINIPDGEDEDISE